MTKFRLFVDGRLVASADQPLHTVSVEKGDGASTSWIDQGDGAGAAMIFDSGIRQDYRKWLREGIVMAARFFRMNNLGNAGRVLIFNYTSVEKLAEVAASWLNLSPEAALGFWTAGCPGGFAVPEAWFSLVCNNQPPPSDPFIVAHEYFHTLQGRLGGKYLIRRPFDETPSDGPRWFSEGSADYVGDLVISDNGFTPLLSG